MKPKAQKPKNRLTWKKKHLSDGSGSWYAAKVKILDWEYIVDSFAEGFYAGVFYSRQDVEFVQLSKSPRKTVEKAQVDCEKHLQRMFDKFKTWMKTQ